MKHLLLFAFLASAALAAGATKTYTGVITDTMCGKSHAAMGVQPDVKCVRECIKSGNGKYKYALWSDGKLMPPYGSADSGEVRRQEGKGDR